MQQKKAVEKPTLLLLPGWCNDRTAFDALLPALRGRWRAETVEWRGHGASKKPTGDFGNTELIADAAEIVRSLGDGAVVPLAMAQAGWIAVELCRIFGERMPALVLVDWLMTDPPPFTQAVRDLQDPAAWKTAHERLAAAWLNGTTDGRVIDFARRQSAVFGFDMWSRSAREIGAAYRQWGSPLEALRSLASPPQVLHLRHGEEGDDDAAAQRAFAERHPWFRFRTLEGVRSHYPAIEAPWLVAEAIDDLFRLKPSEAR